MSSLFTHIERMIIEFFSFNTKFCNIFLKIHIERMIIEFFSFNTKFCNIFLKICNDIK